MKYSLLKQLLLTSSLVLMAGNAFTQTPAPTSKEALVEAYQTGEWTNAQNIARELLKTDPDNINYLNILGVSLGQTQQHEEAESIFLKVKSLNPDDNQIYANLCYVQNELKRDSVLDTCLEATKRITDNAELFYLTAQMLEGKKRKDEALKLYESAYHLNENDVRYLTAMTSILSSKGEYLKAAELTEKAIQSGKKMAILYLNAILTFNRAGYYEKALQLADEGFASFHDPVMILGKAEALTGLKRYEEADVLWEQTEPLIDVKNSARARLDFGYAKSLLARSCSSETIKTCATETSDPCCARERKALELLEVAMDKEQKQLKHETTLTTNFGLAMILNNRLEDAEALLTKAVNENMSKDNAGALAALAVALYQFSDERDREAGRRYYQQAVEASPDFADIERIRETRVWPPRLLDTLKTIQDDVANAQNGKNKKSGCSCDLHQNSSTPFAGLICLFLAFLGLMGFRRKSTHS